MQCIAPGCDRKVVRFEGMPETISTAFCATHHGSPRWQRAAWVSVYNRKAGRAPKVAPVIDTEAHELYDASNIAPRLWIGAKPPLDRSYPGVDMIVLCAAEYQPRSFPHFDKTLIHCPLPDDALSTAEQQRAVLAARAVAAALKSGKRVLSTCQQGRNRSALVAGIALGMITRASPEQIVDLIRTKRMATCLTNPHFREYLQKYRRAA